jgi:2-polyprenyl-6-methoxyphenol hydroxylase-like FAD-dependent oxidoreductase
MRERHVVIVGAGFSGTALAINLLRNASAPLCIRLIDREQIARGVAYARRPFPYLLNVPAGRMSATVADPDEFLRRASCTAIISRPRWRMRSAAPRIRCASSVSTAR